MTEREKLIRLIEECGDIALSRHIPLTSEMYADYLLANGVIAQSDEEETNEQKKEK